MKIRLFTNEVAGGWNANDLDQFLGGSEEAVVLLSEAFVRAGYDVNVYQTMLKELSDFDVYKRNGVVYSGRKAVDVKEEDILITFKDNLPWRGKEKDALVKIHWSAEVELPWNVNNIDAFVCLSPFHLSRMVFVPNNKKLAIPLGIDRVSLTANTVKKEPDTMLYCSSPDRGLIPLLNDWESIRKHYPDLELRVAYGFRNLENMAGANGKMIKNNIMHQMNQPGIVYLGELSKNKLEEEYHRATYWVSPLSNPDSELFCLNALKARYSGCIPVVNKLGALRNTVGNYMPYELFREGDTYVAEESAIYDFADWDSIVSDYWQPLFEKFINI